MTRGSTWSRAPRRFTVEDSSSYDAPPGTWITVPCGAGHTFANPGEETAVILNTFTPDLYIQYLRDMRDPIDPGRPSLTRSPSAGCQRFVSGL